MNREERIKKLGLPPGASQREILEKLYETAETPEEQEEAAEMLQILKEINIDDSLEIVVRKFPLKYILQLLVIKHGRSEVMKSLVELTPSKKG